MQEHLVLLWSAVAAPQAWAWEVSLGSMDNPVAGCPGAHGVAVAPPGLCRYIQHVTAMMVTETYGLTITDSGLTEQGKLPSVAPNNDFTVEVEERPECKEEGETLMQGGGEGFT